METHALSLSSTVAVVEENIVIINLQNSDLISLKANENLA